MFFVIKLSSLLFLCLLAIDTKSESLSRFQLDKIRKISNCLFLEKCDSIDFKESVDELLISVDNIEKRKSNLAKILVPKKEGLLLSFVITCYNRVHSVCYALDSILNQKYDFNYEVICVDDCSTDNTHDVLKQYQINHDNVFVHKNNINKGAPASRDIGIAMARGELIFNLDSDDIVPPVVVQKMVSSYLKNNCNDNIICFESSFMFDNKERSNYFDIKSDRIIPLFDSGDLFNFVNFVNLDRELIAIPWCCHITCRIYNKKSWFDVGGHIDMAGHDTFAFGWLQLCHGFNFIKEKDTFYYHCVWESQESKWFNDSKNGLTCISVRQALKDSSELFNPEFENYLDSIPLNKIFDLNFNKDINLFSIPASAIKYLFKAYNYERNNMPGLAVDNYINAIKAGSWHLKIYLKAIRQAIICNDFKKIKHLLNENQLILAIKNKEIEKIKYLISKDRGLIFLRDNDLACSLHYAAKSRSIEILSTILNGINKDEINILIGIKDCYNNTPIDLLDINSKKKVLNIINKIK